MMYFRRGRSTWTRWFGSVVFFVLVGFVFHEQYSLFQLQISSTDCSHSLHLGRRSEKSGIGVWHGTSALGASNIYVGMCVFDFLIVFMLVFLFKLLTFWLRPKNFCLEMKINSA